MSHESAIKAEITRFVDASQPGFVELSFIDAIGRTHWFVEKVPVVTAEDLDASSVYPRASAIDCRVLARGVDDEGRMIFTVDTSQPWGIYSTVGQSTFVVRPEQLEDIATPADRGDTFAVFVDVDDTLVRSAGTKRLPIPHVVQHVRDLAREGAAIYLWSRAGADYARATAKELGIADCFRTFLPKPNIIVDDEELASWRSLAVIHPSSCRDLGVDDYRRRVSGG
jgi:hypothetical protein